MSLNPSNPIIPEKTKKEQEPRKRLIVKKGPGEKSIRLF
jgi:hypothetical protein